MLREHFGAPASRRRPASAFGASLAQCGCLLVLNSLAATLLAASEPQRVGFSVPARITDALEPLSAADVHLQGWLGARVLANATNRLLTIDTVPLLAGFKTKPGTHPWIGEHVGKWLHAATLAWANTADPRLRAKLDDVTAELVAAQEPDGYLGTYLPEKRFGLFPGADWDVWSHKYNLIGLLTYYEYTGTPAALRACRRMGDLLVNTFGDGKKSILSAGTHMGMASTSVLEPMVLLYRFTGDERYLEFCKYIVRAYTEPKGPRIIDALLETRQVNLTANAKAYEMLSNLVGLCELARATGDRQMLTPILNAWQDITAKRLYITGSASQGEHFRADYELPNETGAHVAETCVTTTWIQLNLQLLRLTGDARFANELEKTFYNHLTAAQHPRGDDWCYFTPLSGRKPYDAGITCCHSSGPRGLALAPLPAYLKRVAYGEEVLAVNTFETSTATLDLGGTRVSVRQESQFPLQGTSKLSFSMDAPARFAVQVRVPFWSASLVAEVNGKKAAESRKDGWLTIASREWKAGDRLALAFDLKPALERGTHGNDGLAALRWGPYLFAYDPEANPGFPGAALVGFAQEPSPQLVRAADTRPRLNAKVRSPLFAGVKTAMFLPFADAGASGGNYRVWLAAPGAEIRRNASVMAEGEESRSREGNVAGSINDGDRGTFVVTFNGEAAQEDWFAINVDRLVTISRVVFTAGNIFHDGGWFDTSQGKPRIQIRSDRNGAWETVAELAEYPATTATDSATLKDPAHRTFAVALPAKTKAYGVRVAGKPAGGDNPRQAFSSCAELEAF